jgi:hypothetical protein
MSSVSRICYIDNRVLKMHTLHRKASAETDINFRNDVTLTIIITIMYCRKTYVLLIYTHCYILVKYAILQLKW